ncbi:hypothetical protein Tco_1376325 [Tanacetum coccineum]
MSTLDKGKQTGSILTLIIKPTNPYARPVTKKCFKCGLPRHLSSDSKAMINLTTREDDYNEEEHEERFDEEIETDISEVIGKYKGEVTCDIVDLDVCLILLERPWEYDVNAIHKGKENTYSFIINDVKKVLVPLMDNNKSKDSEVTRNNLMILNN